MQRLNIVSVLVAGLFVLAGCEGGDADGVDPIVFTPPPAPAGTGFMAPYAPLAASIYMLDVTPHR
jgi:hypothetical protein